MSQHATERHAPPCCSHVAWKAPAAGTSRGYRRIALSTSSYSLAISDGSRPTGSPIPKMRDSLEARYSSARSRSCSPNFIYAILPYNAQDFIKLGSASAQNNLIFVGCSSSSKVVWEETHHSPAIGAIYKRLVVYTLRMRMTDPSPDLERCRYTQSWRLQVQNAKGVATRVSCMKQEQE